MNNSVEVRTANYSHRQKLISKLQRCFICKTLLSKPTSSLSDSCESDELVSQAPVKCVLLVSE